MATGLSPTTGTGAPAQQVPLVLPSTTAVHMIAFAEHPDARKLLDMMEQRVNEHRTGAALKTIVTTKDQFVRALQAEVDLMLVSAHGPVFEFGKPLRPVIGDGNPKNRVDVRDLGHANPVRFGARTGIIWDVCHTGRPAFRDELARLSAAEVVHVAPIGKIVWDDSVHVASTIFDALFAYGSQPITPTRVAAAAIAAASGRIRLWHAALR